ncbi:MAG: hypothetical protein MUD10_00115 [Candidatus Pacebacteria bacterium]|jgi:hypothetical protein|nr:hypothetical protein [Candidatus Paceibacterota bacterium]
MKLLKLYFIGVLIFIGFLIASTWMQYNRFQSLALNYSGAQPGQALSQLISQPQPQTPIPSSTIVGGNKKEYTSPNGDFKIKYPSEWNETAAPPSEEEYVKTIFYAYAADLSEHIIIQENATGTAESLAEQYKNYFWSQNNGARISEYQITNAKQQKITVYEFDNGSTSIISGASVSHKMKTAFIPIGNKIYEISVVLAQTGQDAASESENIFRSLEINIPEK